MKKRNWNFVKRIHYVIKFDEILLVKFDQIIPGHLFDKVWSYPFLLRSYFIKFDQLWFDNTYGIMSGQFFSWNFVKYSTIWWVLIKFDLILFSCYMIFHFEKKKVKFWIGLISFFINIDFIILIRITMWRFVNFFHFTINHKRAFVSRLWDSKNFYITAFGELFNISFVPFSLASDELMDQIRSIKLSKKQPLPEDKI